MVRHLEFRDGRWHLSNASEKYGEERPLLEPTGPPKASPLLNRKTRSGSIASEGDRATVETGLSRWRWWALAVFCVMACYQNVVWISYSTIVRESTAYYGVSSAQIQNLLAVCSAIFIPAVFIISPLSDRIGLRSGVIMSSVFCAVGAVARWLGGPSYAWCFVGQTLNGLAGPVICNCPAQLASQWFPVEQRATATAIAWSAQALGTAVAYLLVPYTVKRAEDLALYNECTAFAGIAILALSCAFPPPPPLPASYSAAFAKEGFFPSAKPLWNNLSYKSLTVAWGLTTGTLVGLSTFLNIYMSTGNMAGRFSDEKLGWVGFAGNCINLFGVIALPATVDALGAQRHMKWICVPLFFLCALGTVGFGFTLCFSPPGTSVWLIAAPYMLISLIYGAVTPLCFELAAELVFPVAEESSSAWINLSYMAINVAAVFVYDHLSTEFAMFGSAGVIFLCSILLATIGNIHKRYDLDRAGLSPAPQPEPEDEDNEPLKIN
eukprot:m.85688 g.85688  ORF g.85688 m.85688 type:complete len:493 (-) comp11408_c0_seq1:60-1538(-)